MAVLIRGIFYSQRMLDLYTYRILRLGSFTHQFCTSEVYSCNIFLKSKSILNDLSFNSRNNSCLVWRKRHYSDSVDKINEYNKDPKEYEVFYTFKPIKTGSAVNNLKRIFSVVAVAGIPAGFLLKLLGLITTEAFMTFSMMGTLVCAMLHLSSIIFYNLIGFMYLSKDKETVKISYMSYWGRRVDIYCPVNDIVPFSDISDNINELYVNVQRYSTPQKLRLIFRFGTVLNKEHLKEVFGESS